MDAWPETPSVPGRVSVIIPAYNHGLFLGETLESVLAQTYTDVEVFVLDDGSSDNTAEVTERFASRFAEGRFRLTRLPHGGGQRARNHGLRLARGEFIQFLDADDLLHPQKLALQVAELMAHPAIDIIASGVAYFVNPDHLGRASREESFVYDLPSFFRGRQLFSMAGLSRRDSLKRVGFWDEELGSGQESNYFGRALACGLRAECRAGTLSFYRIHNRNLRRTAAAERMIRSSALSYERILETARRHGQDVTPEMEAVMLRFRWLARMLAGDTAGACADLSVLAATTAGETGGAKSCGRAWRLRLAILRIVGAPLAAVGWRLWKRIVGEKRETLPASTVKEIREVMKSRYGVAE